MAAESVEQEQARQIEAEALRATENAERLVGLSEKQGEHARLFAAQAQVWATLAGAWRTAEVGAEIDTGLHNHAQRTGP